MIRTKRIERQLQGFVLQILNEVIRERGLENSISSIQEEEKADILLTDKFGKPILFFELKDPRAPDGRSVFDYSVIWREYKRARKLHVKYFGICNFIEANLIDIDSFKDYEDFLEVGKLFTIQEIDRLRERTVISSEIKQKFRNLANWYIDKALEILEEKLSLRPIDERFIYKLKSLIRGYVHDIAKSVWDEYQRNVNFKNRIQLYFREQQWTIPTTYDEIENFTYIAVLFLLSRIVFYKSLHDYNVYNLPKLFIPENITTGEKLKTYLWNEYFEPAKVITKDFELLIGNENEVINEAIFLNDSIIDLVKNVIQAGDLYDFSKISYDVIGRIFEDLIREDERHKLGQYFTPSSVVDLINAFCIRTGDEKILDPSCGSGTFLVRAYERKKKLRKKIHTELLEEIYGVDISSYAAYLSVLNLAIRDLRYPSYPKIINKDFFDIFDHQPIVVKDPKRGDIQIFLSDFDSIIGNPPYTRQEEIDSFKENEKRSIKEAIKQEWGIDPSKRSSIYAYFFYHSGKLLKEKGYLGFITSNSWLDTDYGKDLQKWMLDNFKIITIIDSKVERFFPVADVNTVITILQKESKKEKRSKNLVRFVYLKERLQEILTRFGGEDNLRKFIEKTTEFYEDVFLRIKPVRQEELYDDSKWGKYLRADKVFWTIFKKSKGKWIKLKNVAKIRRGFTTGANEFFYVKDITDEMTNEKLIALRNNLEKLGTVDGIRKKGLRIVENGRKELWLLEKDFLKPVVKSPREIKRYIVEEKDLKYKIFLVGLIERFKTDEGYDIQGYRKYMSENFPYSWEYILEGERVGINNRPTCKSRPAWWDLGKWNPVDAFWFAAYNERFVVPMNKNKILEDKRFYGLTFQKDIVEILSFLNSTLFILIYEIGSRLNFGEGATEWAVYEVENLNILNPLLLEEAGKIFKQKFLDKDRCVDSIFAELSSNVPENISLSKVKPDRLELDRAILNAIGFTDPMEREEVLLQLYRTVVDLVQSRLKKAQSIENRKKANKKLRVETYLDELEMRLNEKGIIPAKNYYFAIELESIVKNITSDRKLQRSILNEYWKRKFGESYNLSRIIKEKQGQLF